MSLRGRVQWLVTALLVAFTTAFAAMQIVNTRNSVREEITGASQVAARLLARIAETYAPAGPGSMEGFLQQLGRVRANDLFLYDAAGNEMYRSPASAYKAGRAAPTWYAQLVAPRVQPREIPLGLGRLVVRPDTSRAVLDGWDELGVAMGVALIGFVLANLLLLVLTGRALRPLKQITDGLNAMERGQYGVRLPPLPTREMAHIGQSFNRMAAAVASSVHVREAEARARTQLAENRALTGIIQRRIEQERGAIARELHDELGQQITAIKSIALSIAQRTAAIDPQSEQAARLVMATADQIYDVLHLMIPRLRPLALDRFGLADAVEDMVSDWRAQQPLMQFDVHMAGLPEALPEPIATAAYRIVQEAVNNAIRHADATRVAIEIGLEVQATSSKTPDEHHTAASIPSIRVVVTDNGHGLPENWARAGHFGLLGMRERAELLGGRFDLSRPATGGVEVIAWLPFEGTTRGDPAPEPPHKEHA